MPRFDLESLRQGRVTIGRKEALYCALGLAGAAMLLAGSAAFRSMMHDEDAVAATATAAPAIEIAAASPPADPPEGDIVETDVVVPPGPEMAAGSAQHASAGEEVTPLEAGNPRWPAFVPHVARPAAFPVASPAPDAVETAAIAPREEIFEEAGVPVAESDAQIAALEAVQEEENEAVIAAIREENRSAFNSPVLRPARVTDHVNLRAGPSDGADVLLVVPRNAEIEAAADCNWCEAVYDGRRGFIYRTFIRRGG